MADDQGFDTSALELRALNEADPALSHVHEMHGVRCGTEERGYETPGGYSRERIVVDASEGFVPLWAPNVILRWRFAPGTLQQFSDPVALGARVEALLAQALLAWGDAAPIRFAKRDDAWDFEIVVKAGDDCNARGCVLASAFFPDAGRHQLVIYPKMFQQPPHEQVETMIHEIGHVFGLRHFFAPAAETAFPAEIFGRHVEFTIMNYGANSYLTDADREDLKRLYQLAWSGQLTKINGTPIRFVRPYHDTPAVGGGLAIAAAVT